MFDQGSPRVPPLVRLSGPWFGLLILAFLSYAAYTIGGVDAPGYNDFFNDGVYNVVMLGSALTLLVRAACRPADRTALLLIGMSLLMWAFGDLYYTLYFTGLSNPPTPSLDDALYLSSYPLMWVGLGLLIRARFRGLGVTDLLDGLIAGLGLGAVAAGLVLDPILASTGGSFAVVATNLAYPVADLFSLLMIVTAIAVTGWRPGAMWALMAASLAVNVAADTIYLFQVATGAYVEGAWLETLWPLSSLLLVGALWVPSRPSARRFEGWRNVAVPSLGALAAVGVLFVDHGGVKVNDPARYLAVATLLVAVVRIVLAFRRSLRLERDSRQQAVTDALTGLGNRRMLAADLDELTDGDGALRPRVLVMYDLNGFKLYNDNFGHPAGDSLLARLGHNLARAVAPYGKAYRMGGDEFCALLDAQGADADCLAAATAAALAEMGHGFEIDAAYGLALIPADASTPAAALQLADRRLYASKEGRPVGVKRQLRGVLLQVLGEREPSLLHHLDGVAALALAVGRKLRLDSESLDVLVRAAEMHDIGKMAIPETILNKPGPLSDEEWVFMRRHTILGERILSAAPALIPVAKLVRSSHERWEGGGYPDGLAGEKIPFGSRIICACDAYDAMVSARPYSPACSQEEALAELARCAGSQFDARVVAALTEVMTRDTSDAPVEDVTAALDALDAQTS